MTKLYLTGCCSTTTLADQMNMSVELLRSKDFDVSSPLDIALDADANALNGNERFRMRNNLIKNSNCVVTLSNAELDEEARMDVEHARALGIEVVAFDKFCSADDVAALMDEE